MVRSLKAAAKVAAMRRARLAMMKVGDSLHTVCTHLGVVRGLQAWLVATVRVEQQVMGWGA